MEEYYSADDYCNLKSDKRERTPSFVRFFNRLKDTPVAIIWIDFQGKGVVYYEAVRPSSWVVVNSYAGHIWMAINSVTKERLLINNKSVFTCEPWNKHSDSSTNKKPVLACITEPVYSLKEICVRTIKGRLESNNASAEQLPPLPLELVEDIKQPFFRHVMPFKYPQRTDLIGRRR